MFSRDRDEHHESGTVRRNKPDRSQRPRCVFQRNLVPAVTAGDGVSTYLALTFGTLLSSQGTVASFVLTLSGFPPGASLRSCVSDSIRSFSDPISSVLSRFPLSRFPFRLPRLYQKFRAGLTGRSFPNHSGGASSGVDVYRCSEKLTDTHCHRRDQVHFQATVRIYLPARSVSTALAGRRGE